MFSDPFTRDDSSSLGDEWTEVSGDWELVSNQLVVATAGAIVICGTEQDVPFVVEATCAPEQDAAPRVIVDYTDSSNYLFVQVEWTAESKSIFLYRKAGGTDTLLAYRGHVADTATTFTIRVCVEYDAGEATYYVKAAIVGLSGTLVSTTAASIDTTVGLGSGTTDEPRFTLFALKLHADDDATCPDCGTPNCYQGTDVFGDTTSITDLGSGWTEVAGNATISGGQLILPNGAQVSATLKRSLPFVVELSFDVDDGDALFVLVDYTDANNHHRIEFEFSGTTLYLRIYARAGGSDTLISSAESTNYYGGTVTLWVCVTDDSIAAKSHAPDLTNPTLRYMTVADEDATPANTTVILEADGGQVELNEWGLMKHQEEDASCPVCAYCMNCSEAGNPPRVFEVVISGLAWRDFFRCQHCEDLNGTFYAEFQGFKAYAGYDLCWYAAPTGISPGGACGEFWEVRIRYSSSTLHYYLEVYLTNGATIGGAIYFSEDLGTDAPDCADLQSVDVSPGTVDACDSAATAVCTVSAL